MRHRLVAWGAAASLIAGLAAAATTLRIDGRTAGRTLLSWIDPDHGASTGTVGGSAASANPGGGGGGTADLGAAGSSVTIDGDLNLAATTSPITPYSLADLAALPADGRDTPGGMIGDAGGAGSIGDAGGTAGQGAGGTTGSAAGSTATAGTTTADSNPGERETVVTAAADGTAGDLTTASIVEPDPAAGAEATPLLSGNDGNSFQTPWAGSSSGGGSSGGGGGAAGGGGAPGGGGSGGPTGGAGGGGSGGLLGGGAPGGGGSGGPAGGAVPEPATWLLMVAGFGLIGGAQRRSIATHAPSL